MTLETTKPVMLKFRLPIPNKKYCYVHLPENITFSEWETLKIMVDAYLERSKKTGEQKTSGSAKLRGMEGNLDASPEGEDFGK